MVAFLKRVHHTFLKAHPHVKPALGGDEYEGWQVVNANVFVQFADDMIVYGIGTAGHNFKVTVSELWGSSKR